MSNFDELMWEQFKQQRDEYLSLISQVTQARNAVARSAERLRLLRQLLELDGKRVALPSGVTESGPAKKKKVA
jgi:hypothetical protein